MSALDHIHSATPAIIHRDIKPENILLSEASAKLADFGLAKIEAGEDAEPGDLDAMGDTQWPGMPFRYRTPELVQRARDRTTELTVASDIFQFSTVLYELLTGYNPQRAPNDVTDEIELDLRFIRGAKGRELLELVRQMFERDPLARPNAGECLERLIEIHYGVCQAFVETTGQEQ